MTIGFTCGSFDLFHAGHMLMLSEIRQQVDYLIVGLQSDPTIDRPDTKNKPILTLNERMTLLFGCKYIDQIWTYDTEKELYDFLKENPRNINKRFLGADWKFKPFTGYDLTNMDIIFNSRKHHLSTSELRERVFEAEYKKKLNEPLYPVIRV